MRGIKGVVVPQRCYKGNSKPLISLGTWQYLIPYSVLKVSILLFV